VGDEVLGIVEDEIASRLPRRAVAFPTEIEDAKLLEIDHLNLLVGCPVG
jgi:hypothetical protein